MELLLSRYRTLHWFTFLGKQKGRARSAKERLDKTRAPCRALSADPPHGSEHGIQALRQLARLVANRLHLVL